MLNGYSDRVNLIWQIAVFLRGDYKQSEYGKVVLPLVVLRRLDCVLADTKPAVLAEAASLEGQVTRLDPMLTKVAGHSFYNTSPWDFDKLLGDPENLATNLRKYIGGFSEGAAEVLSRFGFDEQIGRLDKAGLLYLVVGKFAAVDLHPDVVKNHEMGTIYEELVRKFYIYRLDGDGGGVAVAQLKIGDATFWVQEDVGSSPESIGQGSIRMFLTVDDPDTLFGRAIAAGATLVAGIHEEHGWRTGRVSDPFGHDWEFSRPLASSE